MPLVWDIYSQGGSDMYKLRRKLYSQNFLHSRELVKKLIRGSSIGKNDLVLEIGPGKGIITEELIKSTRYVIAIEVDSHWIKFLQNKFQNSSNLNLLHEDFLNSNLPRFSYKVFANIPFSIEGKIIRKLIDAQNPPEDCYLAIMKELAFRLAVPYKENQFSISHKPWFEFSIYHKFQKEDFTPFPGVDVVMMRFKKKENSLLDWSEREKYQEFIEENFRYGVPVFHHLRKKYGKDFALRALNKIAANKKSKPSYLTLKQWVELYKYLLSSEQL